MSVAEDVIGFDYSALAEFHYQLRRFTKANGNAAHPASSEHLQHNLVLIVRGLPRDLKPTITTLAERLQIRHHSAVELIDRLVEQGLVERRRDEADRRQVTIHLTAKGNRLAVQIAQRNCDEIQMTGRGLVRVLRSLLGQSREVDAGKRGPGRSSGSCRKLVASVPVLEARKRARRDGTRNLEALDLQLTGSPGS
jgi:DNA-binding MarR family transcriptional regulator